MNYEPNNVRDIKLFYFNTVLNKDTKAKVK